MMLYVWGICEGWTEPEVIMMDKRGRFHRIADGGLVQRKVKVLGPVEWPDDVLGDEVKPLMVCG